MILKNWKQVTDYMDGFSRARYPTGKPRSTCLIQISDDTVGVLYHDTVVVIYSEVGITLHARNHRSVTTKSRMNDALPNGTRVFQKNHQWYLAVGDLEIKYVDGITVTWDGKLAILPNL